LTSAPPTDVVDAVRRRKADGVVLSAALGSEAAQLLQALRAATADLPILTRADLASVSELVEVVGRPAAGLYVSSPAPASQSLSRSGRRWLQQFALSRPAAGVPSSAVPAAAATQVALQAIGKSNGTRSGVFSALVGSSVAGGFIPGLTFTAANELAHAPVTVWRVVGASDPDPSVPTDFQGAVFVATITR
jgi:ABC-type branched-subunit amino acid transport system substrate-binding protein